MQQYAALVQMVEADNAWLKRSESHHRAIKMSLVQQHCPYLIPQFEQQQRDKADKKNGVSKKTAASKVSISLPLAMGCFHLAGVVFCLWAEEVDREHPQT